MRLLNAQTLDIQEFLSEDDRPAYAILSHTWAQQGQECTLQSMGDPDISLRSGYVKIKYCCEQALRDGLEWVWVDTCCIDKTSTAELSEAINSMFRWYKDAALCYAYLGDVNTTDDLAKSRWFTRGWTLQELLAPRDVEFYSSSWNLLGSKISLKNTVSAITGIEAEILESRSLVEVTIAKKMSWVAKRKTTRVEDMAYCLLGIFNVHMPLLYGEGQKSFIRLQEEIMKTSYDHTLFAWGLRVPPRTCDQFVADLEELGPSEPEYHGLLAPSPSAFAESGHILPLEDNFQSGKSILAAGGGLRIDLPLLIRGTRKFAALSCILDGKYVTLPLYSWSGTHVARGSEMVVAEPNNLYTKSGKMQIRSLLVKAPTLEPKHVPPPLPFVTYTATIDFQDPSDHPDVYAIESVHCSPGTRYRAEQRDDTQIQQASSVVGHLNIPREDSGLHAVCFLQPLQISPEGEREYWRAAVLIGGDPSQPDGLRASIIAVLPEADPDFEFHKLLRLVPDTVQRCTTRSMLLSELASESQATALSRRDKHSTKCAVGFLRYATFRELYAPIIWGKSKMQALHRVVVSLRVDVQEAYNHLIERRFVIRIAMFDSSHTYSEGWVP